MFLPALFVFVFSLKLCGIMHLTSNIFNVLNTVNILTTTCFVNAKCSQLMLKMSNLNEYLLLTDSQLSLTGITAYA